MIYLKRKAIKIKFIYLIGFGRSDKKRKILFFFDWRWIEGKGIWSGFFGK